MVNEFSNPSELFMGLEAAISIERFQTYLEACDGNRATAIDAYALNSAVSSAIYPLIQNLEIALRNSFHRQLSERYGEWWFDELGLIGDASQRSKLTDAKIELVKNKKELTAGRIVASLSFGFWTMCLSKQYEDRLWRRGGLSAAFSNLGSKPSRNNVTSKLNEIRKLRNRIAHHEPILRFDLIKRRGETIELTRMLSPILGEWTERHCRFEYTYDETLASLFRTRTDDTKLPDGINN